MMKRLLGLVAASCLLAAPSAAQCSNFDIESQVDPTGTVQTVTIEVTGSEPFAPTYLVAGQTSGSISISLLGDSLDLGLVPPFAVAPIGTTDANGDLSASIELPANLGLSLFAQTFGVGVDISTSGLTVMFCESNVDTVTL